MQSKREIKFRLINNYGQLMGYTKWYHGKLSSEDEIYFIAQPCWLYSQDNKYWNPSVIDHRFKDQYTGLKDSNGVEIYEGDILGCNDKGWKGEVFWCEHSLQWMCNDHSLCDIYMSQVIGNIYQNEELLK